MDLEGLAKGSEAIAFNAMIGVTTTKAEKGHFEVMLPSRPDLMNHIESIHAVPILAPAEMASGMSVASALEDLMAEGIMPIAKSMRVRYRKPAKGDLTAIPALDPALVEKAKAEARETGRADFEVPVEIRNPEGEVVAEVVVEWAVRRMG
jgi:acyl-coenzyme A thioesterase PaaI-like protein